MGKSLKGKECGKAFMAEHNYRFSPELKEAFQKQILEDRKVPEFPWTIKEISYMDGCKVLFENGGWISVRFSGTEPLLRVFAEMEEEKDAETACEIYRNYLNLE